MNPSQFKACSKKCISLDLLVSVVADEFLCLIRHICCLSLCTVDLLFAFLMQQQIKLEKKKANLPGLVESINELGSCTAMVDS